MLEKFYISYLAITMKIPRVHSVLQSPDTYVVLTKVPGTV